MKHLQRAIALVLTLCMVLCLAPTQAFAAVTSSSVQLGLWITNCEVYEDTIGTRDNQHEITITRSDATSEEGVAIADVAPVEGYSSYNGGNTPLHFWTGMYLGPGNDQTTEGNDDETGNGIVMTHVRYQGQWQYKTGDGEWHDFDNDYQLVAYYLQSTEVTDHVTTYTKDWGYETPSSYSGSTEDSSQGAGQVAMSFGVVVNGAMTPATEAEIYANTTTIFNYWENRNFGIVSVENNSFYTVEKITVTRGTRHSNSRANVWYGSDSIDWEKTTNDTGTAEVYDETVVWSIHDPEDVGTAPSVNGTKENLSWTAKNQAFLVLIYLKAADPNLTVKYVDDHEGTTIFTGGIHSNEGENFYNIQQSNIVPQTDGPIALNDDAYLAWTNPLNGEVIHHTFEKSLLGNMEIAAKYRTGAYKYVGAEIADNGETLILHYDVDDAGLAKKYVVDFGLPLEVHMKEAFNNVLDEASSVKVNTASFGTAFVSHEDEHFVLTYVPTQVLTDVAVVSVTATFNDGSKLTQNIGFYPASTVYYEEGFATYYDGWTLEEKYPAVTDESTGYPDIYEVYSTGTGTQALQEALSVLNYGDTDESLKANYGHDSNYAAETGMTNGTEAVATARGTKAEFSFTGTGLDIYANCDADTANMMVTLYQDGVLKAITNVDTAFVPGTTDVTAGQTGEAFSLPVRTFQNLEYGNYKAVIQLVNPDPEKNEPLRLDGFKVYNTLRSNDEQDLDLSEIYVHTELNPSFVELRNAVLKSCGVTSDLVAEWAHRTVESIYTDEGTLVGAVVLDKEHTDEELQDLTMNGPKNEVYLYPGQAITFTLAENVHAQIGMQAINGAVTYSFNNGTNQRIMSSADMFYHAETMGEVTIVNNSYDTGAILSLTKLKVFGGEAGIALAQVSADQILRAMSYMGLELNAEVPDAPETEEVPVVTADAAVSVTVVDYKGRTVAEAKLTANGAQGYAHSFAAEEVLAAVQAQLPQGYALLNEDAFSDMAVGYGENASLKVQAGKAATVKVTYVTLMRNKVVGEAEFVMIQTSDRNWTTVSAADVRGAAPAGYKVVNFRGIRATYGTTSSVTVPVI